jgi:hypothetical protein
MAALDLRFRAGTLELRGLDAEAAAPTVQWSWDKRSACWRAPALAYAPTILALRDRGLEVDDQARAY